MKKSEPKGIIMLLITAFIWGTSFVAQSLGMEKVEAFTFNGIRTLIGAFVLLPVVYVRNKDKWNGKIEPSEIKRRFFKTLARGSVLGLLFLIASNLQQFAFYYSTAGKIAFVTAFYMFFVPLIKKLRGMNVPRLMWACVFMGIVGMYLLCIDPASDTGINKGDLLTLLCSFVYAIHITLVDEFSVKSEGTALSVTQFFVAGTITVILMFIFETPEKNSIIAAGPALLYSGILSCGVAYTLQIVGQKHADSTVASIIMCLESVFAALSAAVVLGEHMTGREVCGCVIMMGAIVISQLVPKLSSNKEES